MSVVSACSGDIIGSRFEGTNNVDQPNFRLFTNKSRFTDDSVLTVATMDAIMRGGSYTDSYKAYYKIYPHSGYGSGFKRWANSRSKNGYNSFGNGSAMRVSPVAYAYDKLSEVLKAAKASAMSSHNHEEGIRGAVAVATAVFMARHGFDKELIKVTVEKVSGYDLDVKFSARHIGFDVSCQGSVPQAIHVFLAHNGFENIVRKAVMLGGDTDTIASISGAIAGAYYGIPKHIEIETYRRLPMFMTRKIEMFMRRYVDPLFHAPYTKINEDVKSLNMA